MPKSKGRSKKGGGKPRVPRTPPAVGKNPMASDQAPPAGYGGEFSAGARQAQRRGTAAFKRNARGR